MSIENNIMQALNRHSFQNVGELSKAQFEALLTDVIKSCSGSIAELTMAQLTKELKQQQRLNGM